MLVLALVLGALSLLSPLLLAQSVSTKRLHLLKAEGKLTIDGTPSTDRYSVYFHIPIALEEQTPVLIQVEGPDLLNYRFVRFNERNVIACAEMRRPSTTPSILHWTGWVIVGDSDYSAYPANSPLPQFGDIPVPVRPWLRPTDCSQSNHPFVQGIAASLRTGNGTIGALADAIAAYCRDQIPNSFVRQPWAFDAFYTLNWGNSCTGHAHAAAALFRANGVPARSLLNIPANSGVFDMHWIVDYYVPRYGWVKLESTQGFNLHRAQDTVVVFASNPEDEFPVFYYPFGLDNCWHTSDPAFSPAYPNWNLAHSSSRIGLITAAQESVNSAIESARKAYEGCVRYRGTRLTAKQNTLVGQALYQQQLAVSSFTSGDASGFLSHLQSAADKYEKASGYPERMYYSENFEKGPGGWTHGGSGDDWELGMPSYGWTSPHSGRNCWDTNLDGTYKSNADSWLLSPSIDLKQAASACMSFWTRTSFQDAQYQASDYLWADASSDGRSFTPLCSRILGENDDAGIPKVGGWSRVVLDLTPYAGKKIQVRFRLHSDGAVNMAGASIDDVVITGRPAGQASR